MVERTGGSVPILENFFIGRKLTVNILQRVTFVYVKAGGCRVQFAVKVSLISAKTILKDRVAIA